MAKKKFDEVIWVKEIGGSPDKVILAASPIVKSPGSMPYRVVMVKLQDEKLVIWYQIIDENNGHTSFSDGSYFDLEDIDKATIEFCRRIQDRFAVDAKIALTRG